MKYPTLPTLRKYGLTKKDYRTLYKSQGGKCAICGNPLVKRVNIDHQHGIRNWKKLPDEERKKSVRGLLDWQCNHLIVGRGVNLARLKAAIVYLERYEARIREVE